jgi:hypothetical protein
MSGAAGRGRTPTRNRSSTPRKGKKSSADSDASKSPGTARKRNQKNQNSSDSPVKGRARRGQSARGSSRKKNTGRMGASNDNAADIEMAQFGGVRQKSPMKKNSMKKMPNGVSGEEIEELIKPGKKSAMKKAGQKGLEGEWLNIGLLMVL